MEAIKSFFTDNPVLKQILDLAIMSVVAIVLAILVRKIINKLLLRFRKNKKGAINTRFVEAILRFLPILVAVMWVLTTSELTKSFGQTLFQGTTVLAAVAAFAAQSVLSDILCGFMLSSTRPFDIGDRISLESGMTGVVEDITMRHVVLRGLDTQRYVIPNSKINAQMLTNLSYHTPIRSVDLRFSVSYDADPDLAREVILQAIKDSPHSVPGKKTADGKDDYAGVYFLSFGESCLNMGTTAYYTSDISTENFKTDINTRVKKALAENHIEIPYTYINVIQRN